MENKQPSLTSVMLKYSAILGFVLILYSVLLNALDQDMNTGLNYLSYLLMMVILFFAIKEARDQKLGGYLEFGQGVQVGFLVSLLGGIIIAVFAVFLFKYIDRSIEETVVKKALEDAIKRDTPESALSQVEKWVRFMFKPYMLFIMTLLGMCFFGILESLILAAILKKKRDPFAEAMKEVE